MVERAMHHSFLPAFTVSRKLFLSRKDKTGSVIMALRPTNSQTKITSHMCKLGRGSGNGTLH